MPHAKGVAGVPRRRRRRILVDPDPQVEELRVARAQPGRRRRCCRPDRGRRAMTARRRAGRSWTPPPQRSGTNAASPGNVAASAAAEVRGRQRCDRECEPADHGRPPWMTKSTAPVLGRAPGGGTCWARSGGSRRSRACGRRTAVDARAGSAPREPPRRRSSLSRWFETARHRRCRCGPSIRMPPIPGLALSAFGDLVQQRIAAMIDPRRVGRELDLAEDVDLAVLDLDVGRRRAAVVRHDRP